MFTDLIIPKNNEEVFVEIADKLGYKKLIFIYDFKDYNEEKIKKRLSIIKSKKNVIIRTGIISNQNNINKASNFSNLIVVKSSEKDRFFFENKKSNLMYGFEELPRKDFIHQRASGLNQVLCKLAVKNDITLGFSLNSIINNNSFIGSQIMGRIMQNIILCRKYKVNTVIASFADNPFQMKSPHDIKSLFSLLGMRDIDIKNSLNFD